MQTQELTIIDLCRRLGVDRHGLGSIRNFIAAAFFHMALPGALPADRHVAINTAIRRATNRIACQGRHGNSRAMGRLLSRRAAQRREDILADLILPTAAKKLGRWLAEVTEEHNEPVSAVEKRIAATPQCKVDDVVEWLLTHPSAIILRAEEKDISTEFRRAGLPAEPYLKPGIDLVLVDSGAARFFAQGKWRETRGEYYVEPCPFDA